MSDPSPQLIPALRERIERNLTSFEYRSCPLDGRRPAAVVLALVDDEEGSACFILTRRADRLRRHAGQWALPGGGVDAGEEPEDAALRELHEEIGVDLRRASILGRLDDYATRSGFVITPVVVWGGPGVSFQPDPTEVAEVHRVPLALLDRPSVPRLRKIPESDRPVISIPLLGTNIHAPTAAIIYQLREVALRGGTTRVAHFEQPVFAWR
jgi:8-oxo-dGTP pyrophosphatase MutT (NUDIX family)